MGCDVTYDELAGYAAGELEAERAEEIRKHLSSCEVCRRRLKAIAEMDAHLQLLPRTEAPAAAILSARRALSREVRGTGAPEVMTLQEAAEFLRVRVDDLEELVPELPAFEIGGQIRVRRSRLLEWIEDRERTYARSRTESEVAAILAGLS